MSGSGPSPAARFRAIVIDVMSLASCGPILWR
jgi:hypothetical protein